MKEKHAVQTSVSQIIRSRLIKADCEARMARPLSGAGTARTVVGLVRPDEVLPDTLRRLYAAGNGGYGRLGHQVQQDEHKPRQISVFDRAPVDKNSTVSCSWNTCCVRRWLRGMT